MASLDDFERELAAEAAKESGRKKHRHSSSKHTSSHRSRHEHSSRHHRRDGDNRNDSHRHKRPRYSDDDDSELEDRARRRRNNLKKTSSDEESEAGDWVEKESYAPPPNDDDLDGMLDEAAAKDLQRDSWMQAPSALDLDYVQRKQKEDKPTKVQALEADYKLKLHKNEINHLLRDLKDGEAADPAQEKSFEYTVDYEFGDAGSFWRMTKLKAVYTAAKESGKDVEEVALDRFGSVREFDDAREEELELDRRKTYGKGYVGKSKPSGELYAERKLQMGIRRAPSHAAQRMALPPQGTEMLEVPPYTTTKILDQTSLNKLKAQLMKARLKKDSNLATLEAEYDAAMAAATNRPQPDVVVLNAMENRMLTGGRKGEVTSVENTRGRERGLVEENEDMSIEDMVRQERRTKTQNGGMVFAERIAKDVKFDDDLDYMDDNAGKLAKGVAKSDINLRNMAISDVQKMNRILDTCPLCHHEDKGEPPIAPIVSLATRVYLTLPTEPEIAKGGATIVPIQHRGNLLECDDDEWEEVRNFMKALTRMYHEYGKSVIFYENAAQPGKRRHASLEVIPLPLALGETAPAYFREAILASDEEWSQHKKIIDTLARASSGLGKSAFRKSLVSTVPYFHVWFALDGGLGHVVEDQRRWPRGDLFAREIIGGMLDVDIATIKKQGRWHRHDRRVESFGKKWRTFDWTRALVEGG